MKIQKWAVVAVLSLIPFGNFSFAQDAPDEEPAGEMAPLPGEIPLMTDGNEGEAPETGAVPVAAVRVYMAEENALEALPGILARGGGPGAVSLRASEEAFEANAPARTALLDYVRRGGTVFLHTGAARAFGFETVEARVGTDQLAGQLYGRARAALPFGAHPLLWDDGGAPVKRNPNADPTLLPGVNVVFYQLREGDHLVVSHPAGTPLLQVSDVAVNLPAPLYAAAIAPFGRGYAVFTPDSVDLKRADGALFARNLLGLLSPSKGVGRKWVGISARIVENGANAQPQLQEALAEAAQGAGPALTPALPAFGTAPIPAAAQPVAVEPAEAVEMQAEPVIDTAAAATAQVFLSRSEARAYAALLQAGGDRASIAVNLLRARLFLSRGDGEAALRAIEASTDFAPEGSPDDAAISLWRGIVLAGAAQRLDQSSTVRATLLADAARNLAIGVRSFPPLANPNARMDTSGSGITAKTLQTWSTKLGQISQIFALEPPFFQQYGVGDAAITLRGFQNDASLELVGLGVQALANARNFGWRGDREEIVLFPTIQSFMLYRRALGIESPTVPLPAGSAGDVLGQRLIMVAVPSFPLVETDQETGQNRVFALGNNTTNVFARLHSYVLLNALDEGGIGVPVYLQLGLENIANRIIEGDTLAARTQTLEQFARVGGLLTPDQFRTNQTDPVRYELAQLQASGIVTYLYNQYGAGAVVETLQRLGAGQSIDEALEATTNGDQLGLFQDWRDAQFGPRQFPNRG